MNRESMLLGFIIIFILLSANRLSQLSRNVLHSFKYTTCVLIR